MYVWTDLARWETTLSLAACLQAGTPSFGQTVASVEIEDIILSQGHSLTSTVVGRAAPMLTLFGAADGHALLERSLVGRGFAHEWPGVYATARFEGNALIAAFDDDANQYRIAFDDGPAHLISRPGKRALRFDNLGSGPHTVRLEKISQSQAARTFFGFFVSAEGTALDPPAARSRQIEFIGDSDLVGYGNTSGKRECTDEEVFVSTDTQQTYGPMVARHFDADYQVNGHSGIGVVRHYDPAEPRSSMISLYQRALFDDPAPFDRNAWRPQIIVLALGSNDFVPDLRASERWADQAELRAAFEAAYGQFLSTLRAQNPDAYLLLAVVKPPRRLWTRFIPWRAGDAGYVANVAANKAVVAALRAKGERRIDLITLPHPENRGCHWHPSVEDHKQMADLVISYIRSRPSLWQGR